MALLAVMSTAMAEDNNRIEVDIPGIRTPAPEFTLTLKGKSVSLTEFTGKIVILNFWSLECRPCLAEMDSLDELSKRFHDKGLRVLAISIGDDPERVNQFSIDNHYSMIFLVDNARELRRKYKVNAVPITYVIGRDAKFLARFVGARDWSHPDIYNFIESLL